jgi:glyoxylase-like metal-dependent hydrolase (beta-lactamase superfamily II)
VAGAIPFEAIRPLEVGHYTMPEDSSLPGQKIVVLAYLIRHPDGPVLFDTGIGEGHEEAEQRYHPIHRRSLEELLASEGLRPKEIRAVANCHFHLDHCGGNPLFPGTPIFAQQAEYDVCHSLDYTLPSIVDFPGVALELHEGEADVAPGIRIIPTPGHTPGHQSVLVQTNEGRVLLAGQATNDASDFVRAQYAWRLRSEMHAEKEAGPDIPDWFGRLEELDVQRVFFAHDFATWEPRQVRRSRSTGP